MCGIVGFAGINDYNLLRKMNDLIFYRGPDDRGEFVDKEQGVALAMRRLSVIDLETGKQPMLNEDRSIVVVCNGEIYNSPELRKRLLDKGHIFNTRNSDVEVLLHLYEDKGKDMLEDLNGMFAFVIYDKRKNLLFGARDRIGIKPFYYSFKNSKFAFASELKSLLILPWVSKNINFSSLYHYISLQFIPAPDSIFEDIKKLPAGHFFIYDLIRKSFSVEKYWELNVNNIEDKPIEEWTEIIRKKLKEVVKRWTLSDVPIACSLSGGLDSSSIVGLLAESGMNNIRTYTLGFGMSEEQGCNEIPLARKVAERWGTKHHEIIIDPNRVLKDLERMVWHLDEPYGGGLPSWYIYELVSKDVKVCLTGTGGDELFSNYGKFRIYEKPLWFRWLKGFRDILKYGVISEMRDALRFPIGHFYHRYFSDTIKREIIFKDKKFSGKINTEDYLEDLWKKSQADNPRNAVAYVDFKLQLPEEFLLVTDRFSMAHSVEARVPFLDHTLVELVFRIPPILRTGRKELKYIFKQTVKDIIPAELLRAPKRGFVLPLNLWTRRELRPLIEENLSEEYLKRQDIFSTQVYDRIVKPHLSGKIDLTQQVWTLFMFQMWYKIFCAS